MTLRGASLTILKLLAIGVSSMAIMALAFYFSVRSIIFGNVVQVPDLHGETLEGARARLQAVNLFVDREEPRYDPVVEAGHIIEQTPAPGASIKTDRKVKVVLSLGTEILPAPDLQGQTERRAALDVEHLGLRMGDVARVGAGESPPERIIAQDPMPGDNMFRGDRISLLVSRRPREPVYVMPDLTGRPLEEVRRVLEARKLRVRETSFRFSRAPDGTILEQQPLPGYPVSRRDPIIVVVSRGSSV
ncbi:MAG: PASTA domain-containing protein [Acidobacteriota bacterium]